jgi:Flp pilus assembly protein TadG
VAVYRPPAAQEPISQRRTKPAEQGFVLIVTGIAVMLLIGVAALAIDLGRLYVIRAELQSFTDAAALTAARDFDGSAASLARARADAQKLAEGPHAMRWDMGSQPITHVTVTSSRDRAGRRLIHVSDAEPAPVIFLRLFQPRDSATVAATSVATNDGMKVRLTQ